MPLCSRRCCRLRRCRLPAGKCVKKELRVAAAAMGRKSSKAKEKKQKRLEERAAMDAVCAKVDAANRLGDPLEAFPVFKKYDRNGLNVSIECKRVSGLEPATVDWAFDLTKTNMQTMYEQSEWGWKDREKREEMTDDRACYEVQLESKVRRKGLGKFLIQILQLMANSTQMKKVMLTVFKHNHGAYQFFREALQFEIDDSSPSMSGCCGEDCSYEILSRRTKFGDSQHSHADHGFLIPLTQGDQKEPPVFIPCKVWPLPSISSVGSISAAAGVHFHYSVTFHCVNAPHSLTALLLKDCAWILVRVGCWEGWGKSRDLGINPIINPRPRCKPCLALADSAALWNLSASLSLLHSDRGSERNASRRPEESRGAQHKQKVQFPSARKSPSPPRVSPGPLPVLGLGTHHPKMQL
nr:N-alpha-acetyltransferase 40 isoform X1 [Macaca fascicularis]